MPNPDWFLKPPVLERGIRARNWSAAIVGVVFTLFGLSALIGRKKTHPQEM
jgi:hypothetical protein